MKKSFPFGLVPSSWHSSSRFGSAHGLPKPFILFCSFAAVFLSSCKDEESSPVLPLQPESPATESSPNFKALYSSCHTVGPDDASGIASDAADALFSDPSSGLRAKKSRTVAGITPLLPPTAGLRSSAFPADTLAYVVNFADSLGYVVVCADDRVGCPVLACVDNGTLDSAAIDDNPGLAIFMDCCRDYVLGSISLFESSRDSLLAVADSVLDAQAGSTASGSQLKKTYTGKYYIHQCEEQYGPFLKTTWGQKSPYNDKAPLCPDKSTHNKAGCWAVAIGQFLAYWNYPKPIDNVRYDWMALTSTPVLRDSGEGKLKSDIATLMRSIGNHVDMDYGCDGSSCNAYNAINWLGRLGFKTLYRDYSFGSILASLKRGCPVFMDAKRKKVGCNLFPRFKKGHVWLIDGFRRTKWQCDSYRADMERGTIQITKTKTVYDNYLVHINWGWNGNGNGFYAEGCFKVDNCELDNKAAENNYNYKYSKGLYWVW